MTDHTITFTVPASLTITAEGLHGFLDNVVDASAIDYWDDEGLKYDKIMTELVGNSTWIKSMEVTYLDPTTADPVTKVFDHALIIDGVTKLLSTNDKVNSKTMAEVFNLAAEDRLGECDAEQVDYILQMALFGQLVYG